MMVKEIAKSGGDIFKFAGDAMIIVWPPPTTDDAKYYRFKKKKHFLIICKRKPNSNIQSDRPYKQHS